MTSEFDWRCAFEEIEALNRWHVSIERIRFGADDKWKVVMKHVLTAVPADETAECDTLTQALKLAKQGIFKNSA